jgi:hypothetical protein
MRLADRKGMPLWRAKEEIPRREFLAWIAYERIQPFDWGYALVAASVQASMGGKRVDPLELSLYGKKAQKTDAEMMQILKGLCV